MLQHNKTVKMPILHEENLPTYDSINDIIFFYLLSLKKIINAVLSVCNQVEDFRTVLSAIVFSISQSDFIGRNFKIAEICV